MGLWNTLRLKSNSPEVRRKALESLDAAKDPRSLEPLVAGLRDEDAQVRCAAVKGLEQIKNEQSVAALANALKDPSSDVREAAAAALGQLGDAAISRELANLLKDSAPAVRASTAAALRSLGWRPSNPEEQAAFEVALGNTRSAALAGQAAVKALVTELKHDTSFNRRAAAEALEHVDDRRATQPLLAALGDQDPTVKVSAIHALS
jgi:HEAT repeat protein